MSPPWQLVERVPIALMTAALTEHYDPLSSVETANAIATLQHLLIYDPPKRVRHTSIRLLSVKVGTCSCQ